VYDRGTYYNRIGTFPLVVTARELGVPTAVGSDAKRIEEFRFEKTSSATLSR